MRRVLAVALLLVGLDAAAAEPRPGPDATYTPPVARRFRLENGLNVLVVPRHGLPLVTMTLVVPGAGSAADPPGKPGLAAYTADLLDEGAGGNSALEIARAVDGHGARLTITTGFDAATVTIETLKSTVSDMCQLMATVVAAPDFDAREARRVLDDRLTHVKLRRDRPRELSGDLLLGAIYGDRSPHGRPVDGDPQSLARLKVADARAFYQRAWHPAAATLIVAGDVEPEAFMRAAAALVAWKREGEPAPRAAVVPIARPGRLRLVDRPGAEQSDVTAGFALGDSLDPRWEVVLNAYGGGFTGRLTQRLREQLGYLYHVYPSTHRHAGGGHYEVLAPLFAPVTAAGMTEMIALAEDLAAKPMADTELAKARQNLVRGLPERFETNGATAGSFADLVVEGLPDDWFAGYAARVGAVGAEAAKDAARDLLVGRLIFVVVGDQKKVRPAIEKLNLGKPKIFSLEGK